MWMDQDPDEPGPCVACCAAVISRRRAMAVRVRVAEMLSARQCPGTAKRFVFALDDKTGLASVIVRFDLFNGQRMALFS